MPVITLTRLEPLPRDDSVPWTSAQIQEAANPTGPWATIDTIALTPLDTDPSDPALRDLSTRHATIDGGGWYRVIWTDASGGASTPSQLMQDQTLLDTGARPTVMEVAVRLRARTKTRGGKELGTFSDDTRPTASDVEELIDDALDEVLGKVQPIDPTLPPGTAYNAPGSDYERRIRRAVGLYAAVLVELSYFPEQVRSGQSPVSTLQQLYDSRIRALIAEGETGRAEGMGVGGTGGGSGDAPADAAWSYPADGGGMVGWQSRW